jgi:hypothetical protein
MNPFIRAVVRTSAASSVRVLGIEGGFEGLIHGKFRELGIRDVGGILQRGGTILQTARSQEFREPSGQREAVRQINNAAMDAVIVAGALAYHYVVGRYDMKPTILSKLNTGVAFVPLATVLANAAGLVDGNNAVRGLFALLAMTIAASGAQYVWTWGRRAIARRAGSRVPTKR